MSLGSDGEYKKTSYLGEVYVIDTTNGRILTRGQGRFDTEALKLEATYSHSSMGEYKNLMIVLETEDGYFCPLVKFTETFMLIGRVRSSYTMDSVLHWPLSLPVTHFIDDFDDITIGIKAKHLDATLTYTDSEDHSLTKAEMTTKAERRELGHATYENFSVNVNCGFGTKQSWDVVDNDSFFIKRIRFDLKSTAKVSFSYKNIIPVLRAFRAYWMLVHDLIDCEITSIKLGNDIDIKISEGKFSATRKNVDGYRAALSINTPLELDFLVKLLHFYMNPDSKKKNGSSSKIGLAITRTMDRRFESGYRNLDHEIIDLIFALQSLSESIAEREIKRINKANKATTGDGIRKVVQSIKQIESDIPANVKDFYLKGVDEIYRAISRPTFSQSLSITADKLNVDLEPYQTMIQEIERARQQVVHSENYDPKFLIDLLTHGTTATKQNEAGETISMAIGIRVGSLDHLYDLIVKLIQGYIKQYNS